ncbi:MAG: GNAT family N-acetyltransferase [Bifidobacteriaceae bacterium]|nr:GNAT family N-acetyltransferase [Bifidobacteriaceae bacterium]
MCAIVQDSSQLLFSWASGDQMDEHSQMLRSGSLQVRYEVFVHEQKVPLALEVDARDDYATTIHVLGVDHEQTPVCTGRLLRDDDSNEFHIGRLAVRKFARGKGYGAQLMFALEKYAISIGRQEGYSSIRLLLSAQEHAMGFYSRCGYEVVSGKRYLDVGIWHQDMCRELQI